VAAREQVALQPALAEVLGEDLHHPAVGRRARRRRLRLGDPRAVGDLEHRAEAVGRRLVGAEDAEGLGVAGTTSRMKLPRTRIASLETCVGAGTSTA
jgi:hypothetical protein